MEVVKCYFYADVKCHCNVYAKKLATVIYVVMVMVMAWLWRWLWLWLWHLYVCISITGIELLLSAGMSIHFRSGNSSTRHDQFLAKVMPNFSVNSNSFSSSISASHHVVSRRVRGALQ